MNQVTGNLPDLTLVIDIGKSHAKLLWVDDHGMVVDRRSRDNRSVQSPLSYPALDIAGLTDWIQQGLTSSSATHRCKRVMTCTHGAAFVALGDEGLAWEPIDYEFDGFASATPELAQDYLHLRDDFSSTLAPDLPAGLNAGRQLYWFQHTHADAWAKTRCLLPYPQYWAWWLCGVASSEVSSLGCHTQLWSVKEDRFSDLAESQGWAALFAPLKPAWQVLGTVCPQLADALGLPHDCQVHVGVHDSNACLARYLSSPSLTLVSSGTWTVLMAPAAPIDSLQAGRDMLGNVSVLGQPTPTARFMGGREFSDLLDGAPADLGTARDLQQLMQTQTFAVPAFAQQGGPFMGQHVRLMRLGQSCELQGITAAQRSALAALYCAQVTAWLARCLRPETSAEPATASRLLIVEGPLAANRLYMGVLQSLLGGYTCMASVDALEGTARGAWLLSHWDVTSHAHNSPDMSSFLRAVQPVDAAGLYAYHQVWLTLVAGLTTFA